MSTPDSLDSELDSSADQRIKELLRDVADVEVATGAVRAPKDLLQGVQQKLRERSGGKFYEEGWSTARHGPIATYLTTSVLMLVVMGIAYVVLQPLSGRPETVRNQPAPVEVIVPMRPPSH